MDQIIKYPRTPHLFGSALQDGDHDLKRVPGGNLVGRHVVLEEKCDGANSAFFFDGAGNAHAQSRGHELEMDRRGGRERHFNLLKDWVKAHEDVLLDRLEDRYRVFGEWMHAAHSVFYDALPHLFLEFDVLDMQTMEFLSTERRRELLAGLPIVSVPVLYEGPFRGEGHVKELIVPSLYKTEDWRESLVSSIRREGLDPDRNVPKIENSDLAEGIYGKIEENGRVVGRFKMVRQGFKQHVTDGDDHWLSRPIIPNGLVPGVDIFAQPEALRYGA